MFIDDLRAALDDLPHSVTIGGVTKSAIVGDITRTKADLIAGGYFPEDTFEVHLVRSDWATIPTNGTALTTTAHPGVTFRIQSVIDDPSGAALILRCGGRSG